MYKKCDIVRVVDNEGIEVVFNEGEEVVVVEVRHQHLRVSNKNGRRLTLFKGRFIPVDRKKITLNGETTYV